MTARLALLLLLAACGTSKPQDTEPPADTADPSDSATPRDSADPADSGPPRDTGGTGPSELYCPEGMVGVPTERPVYCIDAYETSLHTDGDRLQSVPGEVPIVGLSFDEMRALCEATPVVAADGTGVGTKRMVSWEEWRDAADGVVGEGGSAYPTGDEWPMEACVVPDETGAAQVSDLQPTGSSPDCVSAFGVYDQLGNAWEWTDPGINMDIAAFVVAQGEAGRSFSVDEAGVLTLLDGDLDGLRLEVPGLQGEFTADEAGVVHVEVVFQAPEPFDYHGLIVDYSRESSAGDWMLPVKVERIDGTEEDAQAPLRVRLSEDGMPLTAKVGCAWYAGQADGCLNHHRFVAHPHDFTGTISARCASDPLTR